MRYEGMIYRPPGEWKSYLLQCTVGCSNNSCTFCSMYKDKQFHIRPLDDILEDIEMARKAYGNGIRRVFLCDGDAIIMKQDQLLAILENRDVRGVLDIGGDPVGARVLARFQPKIIAEDYQLIFVLNANRPEVRTPEAAVAYLRAIEATTGLTCSGIVNNTHLCGETTPAEIRKGAALAEEVSRQAGLPVLCHTAEERFLQDVSDLREPVFPITINMKKPWER